MSPGPGPKSGLARRPLPLGAGLEEQGPLLIGWAVQGGRTAECGARWGREFGVSERPADEPFGRLGHTCPDGACCLICC